MSTHNICFHGKLRKILYGCPFLSYLEVWLIQKKKKKKKMRHIKKASSEYMRTTEAQLNLYWQYRPLTELADRGEHMGEQ